MDTVEPLVRHDMWQFRLELSRRLLRWSAFSVGVGAALSLSRDRLLQGFGSQCLAWGLIDGLLGLYGAATSREQTAQAQAHAPERQAAERRTLRRILEINTALDGVYIAGGAALAATRGRRSPFWRGAGLAIIVQGAFLLVFDLLHAQALQ